MASSCPPKACPPRETCHWVCKAKKVPMVGVPVCQKPACITQCAPVPPPIVKQEWEKSSCKTLCRRKSGCLDCKIVCTPPKCKQVFIPQKQNCKTVCPPPTCRIKYERPKKAPKPYCRMICQNQKLFTGQYDHFFAEKK